MRSLLHITESTMLCTQHITARPLVIAQRSPVDSTSVLKPRTIRGLAYRSAAIGVGLNNAPPTRRNPISAQKTEDRQTEVSSTSREVVSPSTSYLLNSNSQPAAGEQQSGIFTVLKQLLRAAAFGALCLALVSPAHIEAYCHSSERIHLCLPLCPSRLSPLWAQRWLLVPAAE